MGVFCRRGGAIKNGAASLDATQLARKWRRNALKSLDSGSELAGHPEGRRRHRVATKNSLGKGRSTVPSASAG